jgi:hypothetical protein
MCHLIFNGPYHCISRLLCDTCRFRSRHNCVLWAFDLVFWLKYSLDLTYQLLIICFSIITFQCYYSLFYCFATVFSCSFSSNWYASIFMFLWNLNYLHVFKIIFNYLWFLFFRFFLLAVSHSEETLSSTQMWRNKNQELDHRLS